MTFEKNNAALDGFNQWDDQRCSVGRCRTGTLAFTGLERINDFSGASSKRHQDTGDQCLRQ
jgi:hypothetical protein